MPFYEIEAETIVVGPHFKCQVFGRDQEHALSNFWRAPERKGWKLLTVKLAEKTGGENDRQQN